MSESKSEENFQNTPPELLKAADDVRVDSLPRKSQELYWSVYNGFIEWQAEKKVNKISENILLAYFGEMAKKYKSSTLWNKYSMLKSTIFIKHNLKIDKFQGLIAFLKQNSCGYQVKKSKVLSPEEIKKFLNEAPDDTYLVTKVALIFGLYGACRHCELVKLTVQDVTYHDQIIKVELKDTKNKTTRNFIIEGEMVNTVKAYQDLRSQNATVDRFFLAYRKGKCINQPLGKNKLGSMPKEIAKYLGLQDSEQYTGHTFRRSSATLCANQGFTMTDLKRLGGWKSTTVAEGYIAESLNHKIKTSKQITEVIAETSHDELIEEPASKKSKLEVVLSQTKNDHSNIALSDLITNGGKFSLNILNSNNINIHFHQ